MWTFLKTLNSKTLIQLKIFFPINKNSIFHLCPKVARFLKITLSKRIRHLINNIGRTRILRWRGRENEKNVARLEIVVTPSSPRSTNPKVMFFLCLCFFHIPQKNPLLRYSLSQCYTKVNVRFTTVSMKALYDIEWMSDTCFSIW